MNKLICYIKERWKFYLGVYLLGYIYPMIKDGTVDFYHLMPIKAYAFALAIILGTAFYLSFQNASFENSPNYKKRYFSLPSIFLGLGILAIVVALQVILAKKGIDISIFVGLPKK